MSHHYAVHASVPNGVVTCFRKFISDPFLEGELNRALQNARRCCANYIAKSRAADIAVDSLRAKELGMIEDVEGLHAEQQAFCVRER
jgi:hypothetical protein